MKILRLSLLAFLFSSTAFILSDQVLYRLWLVPRLPLFYNIPSYDFILVLLPVVIAVLVIGLMLSSWKQVCLVAVVFTLCHQIYYFMSMMFDSRGFLFGYSLENPYNFWLFLSFFLLCVYIAVFSIVWYSKVIFQKTSVRFAARRQPNKSQEESRADFRKNKSEDRIFTRTTYHVVPDSSGWLVKKGRAKKASSAHTTKDEALQAASDLAKSHPLSQVIVHDASGVIKSDRTYEYKHYQKKRKKKEISKKIKKALERIKRRKSEQRKKRRKAAQLGIARKKRKQYLKRKSVKKVLRKKKK